MEGGVLEAAIRIWIHPWVYLPILFTLTTFPTASQVRLSQKKVPSLALDSWCLWKNRFPLACGNLQHQIPQQTLLLNLCPIHDGHVLGGTTFLNYFPDSKLQFTEGK